MISLICGKVFEILENKITILTESGVGYLVWCTYSLVKHIPSDNDGNFEIAAYIQTIVKEDEISLYGFSSNEEREWFNKFLNIQGVGAKMALLILNGLDFGEITNSLVSKDHTIFQKISGIGPKLAKRLVNEVNIKNLPQISGSMKSNNSNLYDIAVISDAKQALVGLGFSKQDVDSVLNQLPNTDNLNSVEALIKYSLGQLTAKKLAK